MSKIKFKRFLSDEVVPVLVFIAGAVLLLLALPWLFVAVAWAIKIIAAYVDWVFGLFPLEVYFFDLAGY